MVSLIVIPSFSQFVRIVQESVRPSLRNDVPARLRAERSVFEIVLGDEKRHATSFAKSYLDEKSTLTP